MRDRLTERLRTFGNLVCRAAGADYTVRAVGCRRADDPLGEIALELNELAGDLRDRRLLRRESEALLGDACWSRSTPRSSPSTSDQRLRLVNAAGARLLSRTPAKLIGVCARAIGLAGLLDGETPRVEEMSLPGRPGAMRDPPHASSARTAARTSSSRSTTSRARSPPRSGWPGSD